MAALSPPVMFAVYNVFAVSTVVAYALLTFNWSHFYVRHLQAQPRSERRQKSAAFSRILSSEEWVSERMYWQRMRW
jgi:hypothetical protein